MKEITSTSANHLANLAKECMESNRRALEGVGFITSTVRLLFQKLLLRHMRS